MSKKKKKKNTGPVQPLVRLSLCMIVKNEEKSIEQALLWAKPVCYEMIVVDTGSSDRTIEAAERMGAKVFHFEWINDFSAARNFAIDKATGNWVAIFDADEYFLPDDAKKLMLFLKQIQSDPIKREMYLALGCQLLNLDDNGNPISTGTQLRVFRNLPFIRYTGKIHERLTVDADKTLILDGIKTVHTGYSASAISNKKKTERNSELLRRELAGKPDDLNLKAYLADVLRLNTDAKSQAEAERLFSDVINSGASADVHKELKHKAFTYFAFKYANDPAKLIEGEEICRRALNEFPENLDFNYFLAMVLNKKGEYSAAKELLISCEAKLTDENMINESIYISANPKLLQEELAIASKSLMKLNAAEKTVETEFLQSAVRLSLCTIVKNEEKNITKLLESVKDIAFEAIVVDTGSTDRTVEIAKEMGASLYYFEWINDFAAARNYAIEQVKGDWVLILDADEYFLREDAEKLSELLMEMQSESEKYAKIFAVSCMVANLDDKGRCMTKSSSVRLFRNIPSLRYTGRIHEQLTVDISKIINADDITLMHTGYSESAHKETGKGQRNIGLLRTELAGDPDNLNLKAYLANSLSMSDDEVKRSEAEALFSEILTNEAGKNVNSVLRVKMYIYLINKYLSDHDRLPECEEMCKKALDAFPGAIDFMYFMAVVTSKKGEHATAWELLKNCEEKLVSGNNSDVSIMIPADPSILFCQMILAAKNLGDIENVVLYSTHVLSMDKTRKSVLGPCIATLLHYGVSESEAIELLSNIYDFGNPDDLLFVSGTAKAYGALDFADKIMGFINRV